MSPDSTPNPNSVNPATEQEALPAPPQATLASPLSIRALFVWNDVRGRSAFALRASLSAGIPILIGWLLGNEPAGLIASIGAFTALYGEQLPYHRRAVLLAGTGVAVVLAIALGILGTLTPVFGVVTVTLFAGAAVLFYNSLNLGRPGAYLLILVCAIGTMVHARGAEVGPTLLLVASGCLCSWLVQMAGYLFVPYGPQRRIVLASARAVSAFIHALGKPGENTARNLAASALQDSWEMLAGLPPDNPFQRLNRRCNQLFAAANRRESPSEMLKNVGHALVRDAQRMSPRRLSRKKLGSDLLDEMNPHYIKEQRAIERRRTLNLLYEGLFGRFSESRRAAGRIMVGTAVSGALGMILGLTQAYWAMAAAALVLMSSGGRKMLVQRGWFRLVGTLAGLVFAEVIISQQPQGLWLVLLMFGLRYIAEMTVMRNYALSVIFITPASLLIATSLATTTPPGSLFLARGVDTVLGVVVATVVLFTVFTSTSQRRLPEMMSLVLDDAQDLLNRLETGDVYSQEIRRLQVRLRRHLVALHNAYDIALNESKTVEKQVTSYWPNVVRVQRLGYDILTAGWSARLGYDLHFSRMQETIAVERDRFRTLLTAANPPQPV